MTEEVVILDREPLPVAVTVFDNRPTMFESGFLYFEVEPWSRDRRVYLKVRSTATLRSMRYWLNRIATWHNVGCVTHLEAS